MITDRPICIWKIVILYALCCMICLLCQSTYPPIPDVPIEYITIIYESRKFVGKKSEKVQEPYSEYYMGYIADENAAYIKALTLMNELSIDGWTIDNSLEYRVSFDPSKNAWIITWPHQTGPNYNHTDLISLSRYVILGRSEGNVIWLSGPCKK